MAKKSLRSRRNLTKQQRAATFNPKMKSSSSPKSKTTDKEARKCSPYALKDVETIKFEPDTLEDGSKASSSPSASNPVKIDTLQLGQLEGAKSLANIKAGSSTSAASNSSKASEVLDGSSHDSSVTKTKLAISKVTVSKAELIRLHLAKKQFQTLENSPKEKVIDHSGKVAAIKRKMKANASTNLVTPKEPRRKKDPKRHVPLVYSSSPQKNKPPSQLRKECLAAKLLKKAGSDDGSRKDDKVSPTATHAPAEGDSSPKNSSATEQPEDGGIAAATNNRDTSDIELLPTAHAKNSDNHRKPATLALEQSGSEEAIDHLVFDADNDKLELSNIATDNQFTTEQRKETSVAGHPVHETAPIQGDDTQPEEATSPEEIFIFEQASTETIVTTPHQSPVTAVDSPDDNLLVATEGPDIPLAVSIKEVPDVDPVADEELIGNSTSAGVHAWPESIYKTDASPSPDEEVMADTCTSCSRSSNETEVFRMLLSLPNRAQFTHPLSPLRCDELVLMHVLPLRTAPAAPMKMKTQRKQKKQEMRLQEAHVPMIEHVTVQGAAVEDKTKEDAEVQNQPVQATVPLETEDAMIALDEDVGGVISGSEEIFGGAVSETDCVQGFSGDDELDKVVHFGSTSRGSQLSTVAETVHEATSLATEQSISNDALPNISTDGAGTFDHPSIVNDGNNCSAPGTDERSPHKDARDPRSSSLPSPSFLALNTPIVTPSPPSQSPPPTPSFLPLTGSAAASAGFVGGQGAFSTDAQEREIHQHCAEPNEAEPETPSHKIDSRSSSGSHPGLTAAPKSPPQRRSPDRAPTSKKSSPSTSGYQSPTVTTWLANIPSRPDTPELHYDQLIYLARNTYIGTITQEDIVEALPLAEDGKLSMRDVCEAFLTMSIKDAEMMGCHVPAQHSAEDVMSALKQARVRINTVSLRAFLRELDFDQEDNTTIQAVSDAFYVLAEERPTLLST